MSRDVLLVKGVPSSHSWICLSLLSHFVTIHG